MLSFDSHPVLAELRHLARAAQVVRMALSAAEDSTDTRHRGELVQELADIHARRDEILAEPAIAELYSRALEDRAATLRIAVMMYRAEQQAAVLTERADAATARAIREGRGLTAREQARVAQLRETAEFLAQHTPHIDAAERRDEVLAAVGALRLRAHSGEMRGGLLRTAQMRGIIAEATPALLRGDPVLLLGETGGAKTALAEHLARHASGHEPELISGYGDITSAQLIGSYELRVQDGATVTHFAAGPLLRAMIEGRPVILDEVNAMPAEFLKRLNRILQLRPGGTFSVQENAGEVIRIAQGFAILATANEQTPHRYRGLDRLSAELVNRFGAESYRVHYPDTGRRYEDFPVENALLATAAVVNPRGELPAHLPAEALTRAARAAFISQQVFAGANGQGFASYISAERGIDGRPGLEETVLAPRTLVAIVQKVAASAGSITLDHALARFVEGVMHAEDRRVLALIISGQGFHLAHSYAR